MTAVCDAMRSNGAPRRVAEQSLKAALDKAYALHGERRLAEPRPITQVADVCSRWFLERKYVDQNGKPKPLTWNGVRGTLFSLVAHVHGKRNANEVLDQLLKRKLLKRTKDGRWLPKAQIVPPKGIDEAQLLRTETIVGRLLQTIVHNSESRYKGPNLLLEVMAQVRKLPSSELKAFRKFTKSHGLLFARAVDLWLESRNVPNRSRAAQP